jgi:succinate dehydrogenase/fumarate reductase flavoprotein subunit
MLNSEEKSVDTDVLVLGAGAAGCGAAMAAKTEDVRVLMLDKGRLESSGCLGGGNDHFMAVLNSGPETDTMEAVVKFYEKPLSGLSRPMIEDGWVKIMPTILDILQDIGVKFIENKDGTWLRSVGFGQPGNWWINIENGQYIKRLLAKKIRAMGVDILDHIMVTKLLNRDGEIAGCVGYNVLDGTFYLIKAKKVVLALGNCATRGWDNSTGNPYNIWYSPYNTGSHFVLPYEAGVKILNMDTGQRATLIPKGFGAPGMNGINGMGGHELNAMGERFMKKYDPMGENGLRINQISGTYQELIEGKGPPFFMDMRHLDKEEVRHLQYVLMPGDKATYLDYCEQRGIDFSTRPLEVEISELSFGGTVIADDHFETNVSGLYNGCLFFAFSGAICGGYYAGLRAAESSKEMTSTVSVNDSEVSAEKERIFQPSKTAHGISHKEVERSARQVMNYYMGYRRNQLGMETALEKLNLVESFVPKIQAPNFHELMKANEAAELIRMCKLATRASMERKESGRAFFRRTDYPELNTDLQKPLVMWQEDGEPRFSWGL